MRTLLDFELQRDLSRSAGLSAADYDVLSTLTEADGHRWRVRDLATRLLWSASRLTHQIGRMERRGLVTREDCEDDRRGAVVVLTDNGLATLKAAAPRHVEAVRENLVDLLTPREIATLNAIAQKVIAKIGGGDQR
jgi:DNA-binding MarR family transcriptional regulator